MLNTLKHNLFVVILAVVLVFSCSLAAAATIHNPIPSGISVQSQFQGIENNQGTSRLDTTSTIVYHRDWVALKGINDFYWTEAYSPSKLLNPSEAKVTTWQTQGLEYDFGVDY